MNAPVTSLAIARPLPARRAGGREQIVGTAHTRLMILMLVYAGAVLLVLVKLGVIAVAARPASASRPGMAAPRGDIVDRNGAPLARTIDSWAIGVHPEQVMGDRQALAQKLAAILPGGDPDAILRALTGRKFVYLSRDATPTMVTAVNALGEPALIFERDSSRLYPQSALAGNVLGYTADGVGKSGLELYLNRRLTDPARAREPVVLSIDGRVQAALDNELGQAFTSFNAKGATGIVLDVDTGEVLAMSSFPSYNPNRPQDAAAGEMSADGTKVVNPGALWNRVTSATYELGSTLKPITVAAGLQYGVIGSLAERYDATRPYRIGGFQIHDHDGTGRWLSVPDILIHSSNIGTARIAMKIGKSRLQEMLRAMGFDQAPRIELPGRARPRWPGYWGDAAVATVGFGHGIAITPLHLATAYAALVNGGIWRPATLMKVAPGASVPGRRVIDRSVSDRMRQMLRMIVLEGTGRKGDAPGFRVGGKTGTAEVAAGGGYSKNRNVSTFAAAFPMDRPRYVVIAMLDSPIGNAQSSGQTTAAYTAAPVVSRFILRAGPMLGVMPSSARDIDVSDLQKLVYRSKGMSNVDPR